jgi:hypothetical protein
VIGDDDGHNSGAQTPTALVTMTSNASGNDINCLWWQYLDYPCMSDPRLYSGANTYHDPVDHVGLYTRTIMADTLGSPTYSYTSTPPGYPLAHAYFDTAATIQFGVPSGGSPTQAYITSLAQGTISVDKTFGVASASYVSGGSASGLPGQTCTCSSFNNSCSGTTATVTLTGNTNPLVGSTWTITNRGTGCSAAPTSCTLGNLGAVCSGTATITSSLGGAHDGTIFAATLFASGVIHNAGVNFLGLPGGATAGDTVFCIDCKVASSCAPTNLTTAAACACIGGGMGAFAKYENYQGAGAAWYCQ